MGKIKFAYLDLFKLSFLLRGGGGAGDHNLSSLHFSTLDDIVYRI